VLDPATTTLQFDFARPTTAMETNDFCFVGCSTKHHFASLLVLETRRTKFAKIQNVPSVLALAFPVVSNSVGHLIRKLMQCWPLEWSWVVLQMWQ
jgi:hypothetical protein